jgi:hypothetical protein
MPRIVKRSASQAVKTGRSRRDAPLPEFVPPQLSRPVEKPRSGRMLLTANPECGCPPTVFHRLRALREPGEPLAMSFCDWPALGDR